MNSLVCAALLARAGRQVTVVERNDRLGGCIRSEELVPGYVHDVLSSWYPLFLGGPAYAELATDLHDRGLEFVNTDLPTGIGTPDGRSLVLTTDPDLNVRRFNELAPGEGDRFQATIDGFFTRDADLTFGMLGHDVKTRAAARLAFREGRSRKIGGSLEFASTALESCRTWLEHDFETELMRGVIAPWVLHAGLGPDDAYSALMGKAIIGAITTGGLPVAVGGSQQVVETFSSLLADHGAVTITGADVRRVIVERGRARGIETSNGTKIPAKDAVVCNVTPQQLYGRLLAPEQVPAPVAQQAERYRYGRAGMQIHYALSAPPTWTNSELSRVAMVHLTAGLDGVSRAVNEAARGLLPAEATIVVGQPTVVDPTRGPVGAAILWIQIQELPRLVKGDAAGEIDPSPSGSWTPELAERYAARIHARLLHHLPDLDSVLVKRVVLSPADLEALNSNLVGGDPYSGACSLDQMLLWRPLPGTTNHGTHIKGLYHLGAATHPGPGLGGGSGYLVAQALL